MERLTFTAPLTIEAATGTDKPRKFQGTAYTGVAMKPMGFTTPVVIELSSAKSLPVVPILKNHDHDKIVGHGEVAISAAGIAVSGTISGTGPDAAEVMKNADNGFPWQMSIGADAYEMTFVPKGGTVQANGKQFAGPVYIARGASIGEISFVALGADRSTSATLSASQGKKMETTIETDTIQAERDRIKAIDRACSGEWGENTAKLAKLRASAIDGDITLEDLQAEALTMLRSSRAKGPLPSSDRPGQGSMIEAALCLRAGLPEAFVGKHFDERTMNDATSKAGQAVSVHSIMFDCIRAAGMSPPSHRVNNDLIRTAFEASQAIKAAGPSTYSLPGILSNVANKSMLSSYAAVPVAWRSFCAVESNRDFKEHKRYRLVGSGQFREVAAGGELEHVSVSEDTYTSSIDTEGAILAFDRRDIINDDMGVLVGATKLLGRMSAIAVERAVFTLLLSQTTFFTTALGNEIDDELDIVGLTAAEAAFLDAVDINGDPVMITPAVLLVPTSLATDGRKLIADVTAVVGSETVPNVNPFAGKFTLVVSPWLNSQNLVGSSSASWYLLAAPGDVAVMEVAFLDGRQNPTIETAEMDFNRLGIQMRAFHDFGAAMRDFRAGVFSNGVS